MGMFDTLRVEVKIPGCFDCLDKEFQTKSFACLMENYVISINRELYKECWDYEFIEDNTHLLGGFLRKLPNSYHRQYLTDYHGDITFYGGISSTKFWRDYHARFSDGRLTKVWYTDIQY